MASAAALGLHVDDAVVLHTSNRIAVRLLPCDVLARVATEAHRPVAEFEVEVARRLALTNGPVAALDPRVDPRAYLQDGFVVTLWTYFEPLSTGDIPPAAYAQALAQLHAGFREIDLPAPHFTDRVGEAHSLVDDREQSPELTEADRHFLGRTFTTLTSAVVERGANEQLLHGEAHPGNLLQATGGLLFIDMETCCRGPVELDLAHAPDDVGEHYGDVDPDLLRDCRVLTLAIATAWRCDRDDQLPHGRRLRAEWINQLHGLIDPDDRSTP